MNELGLSKLIRILINEVLDKRVFCSIVFAIVALSIFVVGLNWPKVYESEVTILWTNRDPARTILQQPVSREELQVRIFDQIEIAKEIVFSNKILDVIIEEAGLGIDTNGNKLHRRQLEVVKGRLKSNLKLYNRGRKIMAFSYKDVDPEQAYVIVSIASELFLRETRVVKNKASQHAYDFINRQVLDYKDKLGNVNRQIIEFRQANVDLDSDTRTGVNARVNQLKANIKDTKLSLNELRVQKQSLETQLLTERQRIEQQLQAESQQAVSAEREGAFTERLQTLESNLDTLRLSYTENYPDIVHFKEQIKNLKLMMDQEDASNTGESTNESSGHEIIFVETPLYVQLAGEIADAETDIQTFFARVDESGKRLDTELLRASKVNALESQLEEMTRDLDVTQRIYDDLLTRRENARVSLNLQLENQGVRFRVQDPASIPVVPVGLRFIHFVIGSVPVALLVPLVIIFGLLYIDKSIRHEDNVDQELLALPVIGVVDYYPNRLDIKKQKLKTIFSLSIFATTGATLITLVILKLNHII